MSFCFSTLIMLFFDLLRCLIISDVLLFMKLLLSEFQNRFVLIAENLAAYLHFAPHSAYWNLLCSWFVHSYQDTVKMKYSLRGLLHYQETQLRYDCFLTLKSILGMTFISLSQEAHKALYVLRLLFFLWCNLGMNLCLSWSMFVIFDKWVVPLQSFLWYLSYWRFIVISHLFFC